MIPAIDHPGELHLTGSPTAELFTRQVAASFAGVLERNLVTVAGGDRPLGFLHASIADHPCHGQCWTRDVGVFLRELVAFGDVAHARLAATYLIGNVLRNEAGFHAYPEHLDERPACGHELDGTAAIIIALSALWRLLPASDALRARIHAFLRDDASPVRFLVHELGSKPLLDGGGEFGPGVALPGTACNVVQNNLARLALLATAQIEDEAGDAGFAALCRDRAEFIAVNMVRHLVAGDGDWLWCVDPATLRPDPAVLDYIYNQGFGGINGVGCMHADVLGVEPLCDGGPLVEASVRTFERLWSLPERRELFRRHGLWVQFDRLPVDKFQWGTEVILPPESRLTSPSYGHGYAMQCMLLHDRLDLADRALHGLAHGTHGKNQQWSPDHFIERLVMTDAGVVNGLGCGELNLVNVAEPLKVARLMLGIDDTRRDAVRLVPRLPASVDSIVARHWPVRHAAGVSRADIRCTRRDGAVSVDLRIVDGPALSRLRVRSAPGRYHDAADCTSFQAPA